ncbi:MAG: transporter substrate-binding domain-containing protein [Christensenellaceae bacterium]|jgi:ABC-type amino acid transport substrate-binding protein|nr:transporter substrate-binding domain-containing protein [Christensenellaceae bacterium]
MFRSKILSAVLALALCALLLSACGQPAATKTAIASPDDFKGHSIAVQTDTTAAYSVNDMKAADSTIQVHEYEKVTQCFDDLKLGRVDAVYVDSVVAAYYTTGSEEYTRVWMSAEGEPMGICLAKNSDSLAAAVEAAIDTLYFNGKMAEIASKHFGEDATKGLRQVAEAPAIPADFATITAGKLLIGAEVGYPPMEYTTEDGMSFVGFDIDVGQAIGEILGLEVEVINTSWDGIFAGLEKGQYDCIISSVSITPERQEAYILTKPYISNALCIVTKK